MTDRPAGAAAGAADTRAGAADAPAAAAIPILPRISPGATSSCSCFNISVSTPAPGEATSTVTLSVSSSMSGSCSATGSPTAFSQRSTCERVPSSCPEGALISTLWTPADMSDTRDLLDGARDGLHAWNGRLEQKRTVRTRNVRHGEPLDRRIQAEEGFLRDGSRDLGTKARGQIVLVHDETSMRLAHRLEHRLLVPGRERPQIEDLAIDARCRGRTLTTLHHGAPSHDSDFGALADAPCDAKWDHILVARIGASGPRAIQQRAMLEKQGRIV